MRISIILLFITFTFFNFTFSQKRESFEGILLYNVHIKDLNSDSSKFEPFYVSTFYVNDTMVRQDSYSENFGQQFTIKHLKKRKMYQLLEINDHRYAVQHHLDSNYMKNKIPYTYKYKKSKEKIAGLKCINVSIYKQNEFIKNVLISKKFNPEILGIYDNIKGLPVQYEVSNGYQIYRYTLIKIEPQKISETAFLISKIYEKISFEDFIKKISQ